MVKLNIVKEMMEQRNFKEYKIRENYIIGQRLVELNGTEEIKVYEYIYIKIFNTKFELNTVREFLSKFVIDSSGAIATKSGKNVVQLVIICTSFQNSHVKELKEISNNIRLIRSDFFNINITKKAPHHQKVDESIIKNKKEIPIIKEDDPNCIFYNFVKGDVIRVTRFDGDICYRLVK